MRRLVSIAAFALILALPASAQRAGGRSGASHGFSRGAGFAGHTGGQFSGAHPGAHGFARAPSVARGPYLHDRFRVDRFRARSHHFGFRNHCFGYPCRAGYGYPWWGYDPWLWWDSDSSNYDEDYERNLAIANEMNQQSLEEQRMLRQEEAEHDQDVYASRIPARPPEKSSSSRDPIAPATMLVFRDRHTEEIGNYAIVGQTLWSFAGQRTRKIPLSDLDRSATVRANDGLYLPPSLTSGENSPR